MTAGRINQIRPPPCGRRWVHPCAPWVHHTVVPLAVLSHVTPGRGVLCLTRAAVAAIVVQIRTLTGFFEALRINGCSFNVCAHGLCCLLGCCWALDNTSHVGSSCSLQLCAVAGIWPLGGEHSPLAMPACLVWVALHIGTTFHCCSGGRESS